MHPCTRAIVGLSTCKTSNHSRKRLLGLGAPWRSVPRKVRWAESPLPYVQRIPSVTLLLVTARHPGPSLLV
jgi:hypothetical protein